MPPSLPSTFKAQTVASPQGADIFVRSAGCGPVVVLLYASRNELIANDIERAVQSGRCPLLLTGRTEHLQYFAGKLASVAKHVFVLRGGMGKRQRRSTAEALASVPEMNRG
jgi:hypothetical protein